MVGGGGWSGTGGYSHGGRAGVEDNMSPHTYLQTWDAFPALPHQPDVFISSSPSSLSFVDCGRYISLTITRKKGRTLQCSETFGSGD